VGAEAGDYRAFVEVERPRRRLPKWVPAGVDAAIALGTTALMIVAVWSGTAPDERFADKPVSTLLLLPVGLSLAFRRRAPLVVAVVVATGHLLQTAVTGSFSQAPALALCIVIALYSLGAHTSLRRALIGGGLVAASLQLKGIIAEPSRPDESPFVALFWWLLGLSVVGLGVLVRSQRRSSELQRDAREREAERTAHERAVVAEERQRIARELHDVVSHNVSASILQAGAAEELLKTDPERAAMALRSIQEMGREAIGEMRRMLGIIREDGATGPAPPQPRLSDLGALVERAGGPGIDARLVIEGDVAELAPGLELSAYRIVQEALTNVTKHAAASRVVVSVRYGESDLLVEVQDDGASATLSNRAGHGLVGMRERMDLLGGELWHGPAPGGGYLVRARVPVDRPSA
jgi:signal transduction histidine kinase